MAWCPSHRVPAAKRLPRLSLCHTTRPSGEWGVVLTIDTGPRPAAAAGRQHRRGCGPGQQPENRTDVYQFDSGC